MAINGEELAEKAIVGFGGFVTKFLPPAIKFINNVMLPYLDEMKGKHGDKFGGHTSEFTDRLSFAWGHLAQAFDSSQDVMSKIPQEMEEIKHQGLRATIEKGQLGHKVTDSLRDIDKMFGQHEPLSRGEQVKAASPLSDYEDDSEKSFHITQ